MRCGGGGAMTINFYQSIGYGVAIGGDGTSGSETGYALDSNFTLGSAGDCAGLRFVAPIGGVHVHSVYWFLHAADATGHDLVCALTGYNSASALRANTTAIRSVNAAGGTTANKWIKFDFSSYSDSLTADDIYWVVVGDAAGNGSGYQIRTRTSSYKSLETTIINRFQYIYTNDAGFTTNGTAATPPFLCVVVFSDGSVVGMPYTKSVGSANNSLERGLKFIFDEKVTCSGLSMNIASANVSSCQIYESATVPNGTVWSGFNGGSAYTIPTSSRNIGGILFPSPVTFEKNTYYRITIKSSSSHTYPGYNEVEDYATLEADALKTLLGAGSWCYTIDNGAGGWTDYNNATNGYRLARMSLILKQQEVIATSGGGGVYTFGG